MEEITNQIYFCAVYCTGLKSLLLSLLLVGGGGAIAAAMHFEISFWYFDIGIAFSIWLHFEWSY